jgi:PEP-CTERM motif-containing protein
MRLIGRQARKLGILALLISLGVAAQEAKALVLIDEDFTGASLANGLTVNLLDNPGNTGNDNLNTWIDFPNSNRWGLTSGGICAAPCSGDFAQHLVQTSDNTNLLFYAFDASGLGAGTTLALDLDYIASNRTGRVIVAGMLNGQHSLDPFAPWFPPGDANDGIPELNQPLSRTNSWTSVSYQITLPQAYDVLAFGVYMGGTTGSRGVDNIRLQSVPEPATIAIFGFGLLGLAFAARRRRVG